MLAISVKNLTYVYSRKSPYEKVALDDVSFDVEKGTFLGIIGKTGSGKSTLIQHLNGLIPVQNKKVSKIVINGMDSADKKTLKKLRFQVGMVFQYPEYQLFEDSVAKDVAFGPKNMKLDKAETDKRVRRAMELVGLDYGDFAQRSPFDLSGGEKRRAAIAGVIAMEPEILVLDEPVAGLDPVGRRDIIALIKKLKKEVSPTVVLVSHNMDDIAALADRIIAMEDGKIALDGTPRQVFCSREVINRIGLELPSATVIRDKIAARGFDIADGIVTSDALEKELARLKAGGAEQKSTSLKWEAAEQNSDFLKSDATEQKSAPLKPHTEDGGENRV
jgi:energy-coupling factor transport system ATP-binding protein